MKPVFFALPLAILVSIPAVASTDSIKIQTVKNMYNAAIKKNQRGDDLDTLGTLFKYADKGLQNAIGLAQISSSTDDEGYFSECHGVYENLSLSPSNGWGLDEAKSISYKVLNNGRVRASIKFPDGSLYKDLALQCTSGSCKVTDSFDSDNNSAKSMAERLCR